jgi:hypothetical protein
LPWIKFVNINLRYHWYRAWPWCCLVTKVIHDQFLIGWVEPKTRRKFRGRHSSSSKKLRTARKSGISSSSFFVCFFFYISKKRNGGVFEMFNQRGLALLLAMFFCRLVTVEFDWLFLWLFIPRIGVISGIRTTKEKHIRSTFVRCFPHFFWRPYPDGVYPNASIIQYSAAYQAILWQ